MPIRSLPGAEALRATLSSVGDPLCADIRGVSGSLRLSVHSTHTHSPVTSTPPSTFFLPVPRAQHPVQCRRINKETNEDVSNFLSSSEQTAVSDNETSLLHVVILPWTSL